VYSLRRTGSRHVVIVATPCGHALQAVDIGAPGREFRRRDEAQAAIHVPADEQQLRVVAIWKRADERVIEQAEDRGIGADTESQRE